MTTDIAQSNRVFSIDALFVGRTKYYAIFEQGDYTSSHLFGSYEDAFNALGTALKIDPEMPVSNMGY
tara:strand:+ start:1127 stop:1327 length:201 start_codon:yes stop_codon:yes gene_type:complete